jgi:hypothetical protein
VDQVEEGLGGEADGSVGAHFPGVRNLYRGALQGSPKAIVEGGPDRRRADIEGKNECPLSAIRSDGRRLDDHGPG